MQANIVLNTQSATQQSAFAAYAAAINAQQRSTQYMHTYSTAQQNAAHALQHCVATAYKFSNCYISARKKFIAITFINLVKFNNAQAKQVQALIKANNYIVVKTQQATIIRIMRIS